MTRALFIIGSNNTKLLMRRLVRFDIRPWIALTPLQRANFDVDSTVARQIIPSYDVSVACYTQKVADFLGYFELILTGWPSLRRAVISTIWERTDEDTSEDLAQKEIAYAIVNSLLIKLTRRLRFQSISGNHIQVRSGDVRHVFHVVGDRRAMPNRDVIASDGVHRTKLGKELCMKATVQVLFADVTRVARDAKRRNRKQIYQDSKRFRKL